MPNKEKNIPKRRFKAFENADAWELRKLGEVIEKLKGGVSIAPNDYIEDGYRTIPKGAVNDTGVADMSACKNVSVDFFEKNYFSKTSTGELITSLRDLVPSAPNLGRIVRIVGQFEEFIMPQGVYSLKITDNLLEDFLIAYSNNYIYRSVIQSEKNGSTQVHIRNGEFLNIKIQVPSLPEQEAIGNFFSTLDRQITLHQRKLDTLKEQKKTYLKLLFPSKGQTKPALRFQGFEDDWEEVKLGEVLSVSKLKNKENEYSKLNVLSVSREQGTVNQIEYQGRSFASDDVSGYKIVNVGQMIYTKSPLKGAPYGIFQTVTINGIVSPLYAVYNSSGRALASFVSLILKEDAIATHYLSPLVTKGAKNTINVTDEGALEGKVKIPTLPEQQAIGTFFQTLDREISQVEDKLASLKELKKTLLRKLFV